MAWKLWDATEAIGLRLNEMMQMRYFAILPSTSAGPLPGEGLLIQRS
jgi:hypothetical protein